MTEQNLTAENLEIAKQLYQEGKDAFERGRYRQSVQSLEKAISLSNRVTRLGGEMQIWLVTAYEANGQREEAIALCEQVSRHPDLQTRRQGKRLLYILKAPRLKTRPEWLSEIPDLTKLEEGERDLKGSFTPSTNRPARPPRSKPEPEPIDLSKVNTQDNRFVWVALGAIALTLIALFWFS